jgi:hypothetical protein
MPEGPGAALPGSLTLGVGAPIHNEKGGAFSIHNEKGGAFSIHSQCLEFDTQDTGPAYIRNEKGPGLHCVLFRC